MQETTHSNNPKGRLLPQDIVAEQSLLGAIIINNDVLPAPLFPVKKWKEPFLSSSLTSVKTSGLDPYFIQTLVMSMMESDWDVFDIGIIPPGLNLPYCM